MNTACNSFLLNLQYLYSKIFIDIQLMNKEYNILYEVINMLSLISPSGADMLSVPVNNCYSLTNYLLLPKYLSILYPFKIYSSNGEKSGYLDISSEIAACEGFFKIFIFLIYFPLKI